MIGQILRRLATIPPALVAVSLVCFLFVSYLPEPEGAVALDRERFADLPRFVNSRPTDARVRAERAIVSLASGVDEEGAIAEVVRLGTVALPFVVPALDRFTPEQRRSVAVSLAPIAERMGLRNLDDVRSGDKAPLFWSRLLADRGAEWADSAVRTKVGRLRRYQTASRFEEVRALDTLALGPLIATLEAPQTAADVDYARSVIDLLSRITQRNDRIEASASVEQAAACVTRWRRYWFVHRLDFTVLDGERRVSAFFLETRFGKWMTSIFDARLSPEGSNVALRFVKRAPTSGAILFGAIALAYPLGLVLGAIAASHRGRRVDFLVAGVVMVLYALPAAVVVSLVGQERGSIPLAALIVALGMVAAPARQTRSALLTQLGQDSFRTFLSKGHSRGGALRKVLRTAALPITAGVALEPSTALGSIFVVEHVFGMEGLGVATVTAVREKDVAFLMLFSVLAAFITMLMITLSHALQASLDPRVRTLFFRTRD